MQGKLGATIAPREGKTGLWVVSVSKDSPAAKADLRKDDRLEGFRTPLDWLLHLGKTQKQVELSVRRGEESHPVTIHVE